MNYLLAALALAALAFTLGVLGWYVPHPDLIGVLGVTFALALWDVLSSVRKG